MPMSAENIHRRQFLTAIGLAGSAALMPALALGQTAGALTEAAAAAYVYGLPLIEMARARAAYFQKGNRPNVIGHDRALHTPATQKVTTPNNDTLYSTAWCDTASGPIRLTVPPTGNRYISIAFLDMFTNNFAVLGTRTTGGDGGVFTLVGPDAPAAGPATIRSPTRWALILVRTLVDGPADLAAAHAVQDAFRLEAAPAQQPPQYATRDADWPDFLRSLQALLVENGAPVTDGLWFRRFAPLGIGTAGGVDPARFSAGDAAGIAEGLKRARAAIRAPGHRGSVVDGWGYPRPDLGNYGQDYLYRAKIALGGLAALPCAEAMYMRALDPDGRIFFPPDREACLRFPADRLPPVDGFWSATMYEYTPDGQFFFFDNAINRYAIGDRTPGLRHNADGSLDIWMTADPPAQGGGTSNWLPLPRNKPWGLVLRTYLPKQALLDGTYTLPPLTLL